MRTGKLSWVYGETDHKMVRLEDAEAWWEARNKNKNKNKTQASKGKDGGKGKGDKAKDDKAKG